MPRNVRIKWAGDRYLSLVRSSAEDGLYAAATVVADAAVRSMKGQHGGVPSIPGQPPHMQSGHLSRSVTAVHARDLGRPLIAMVGTNVSYGRYLEFGATVVPRTADRLAIPLNKIAKRMLVAAGGKVRNIGGLKFVKSKRGKFLLVHPKKGPLFVLVKRSVILPRPWLRPAMIKSRQRAVRVFNSEFRRRMQRFRGVPHGR